MMRKWIVSSLLLVPVGFLLAVDSAPHEVIEDIATAIAKSLDGRQQHLEENPKELYKLIDELLLPNFDTRYAGRLVLGKHWRTASDEQRSRFIQTFYDFLVRSYAKAILGFDRDRIAILPALDTTNEKRALVKTEVRLDNGTQVPVNYSMRSTDVGWKVYDVRIEGISYIQNYRNQFNAEISARGIDAVIARLENETAAISAGEGA